MSECQYHQFTSARELLHYVKEFETSTHNRYCQDIASHKFTDDDWRPKLGEQVRLYWKNNQAKIPFDGIPFMFGGVKAWRCHLGPDLCKKKKEKYRQERDRKELEGQALKRRTPPETKKLGCPAMIHAHRLAKFPDYKVSNEEKLTKRMRDRMKRLLVEASGSPAGVQMEILYLLRLPLPAHHNHPIPYTSVRNGRGPDQLRLGQVLCEQVESLSTAVILLTEAEFLHTFRVTKPLYQFLVEEWHKKEVDEWARKKGAEKVRSPECVQEQLQQQMLAALYYLGSQEAILLAAQKFHTTVTDFLRMVMRGCEFLVHQQEKYVSLPRLEERLVIADGFKRVSGFPGVMGALDAVVIPLTSTTSTSLPAHKNTPTVVPLATPMPPNVHTSSSLPRHTREPMSISAVTPTHADGLTPTPFPVPTCTHTSLSSTNTTPTSALSTLVLQYIVDHTLNFRDLHLALLPSSSSHNRLQVFQKSGAWEWLACLTNCETHVVAPAVYPLAPAILTPHMKDIVLYQEGLYNENHLEAQRVGWRTISLLISRFRRLRQLETTRDVMTGSRGGNNSKPDVSGVKGRRETAVANFRGRAVADGKGGEKLTLENGRGGRKKVCGRMGKVECGASKKRSVRWKESTGKGMKQQQMDEKEVATMSVLVVRAACILHNIALMNEAQGVLDSFWLDQEKSGEGEREMWGQLSKDDEGGEAGAVADFGLLGGEEKRHYLTTVMTDRFDGSLPDLELAGGFGS
ncbi:hypothetical protein Pcinc_019103 [Petrolisthes cinctipes]|uniref:DDE Tnp4 domain-containing protein n=1 Tax=Petrolisthes cinctipes TaxID=88211 RepID=A0AAE1FM45_PETCI|nr:hypothetical protein Pcinc_019103 [Petrolisthes cinctipes]